MTDSDLVYAGRARRRPPGASDLVQRMWLLLHDHPEGMTRDEIHAELADGWLDTDAYRAYEQHLAKHRKVRDHGGRRHKLSYGSDEFKRRAQRWWIRAKLGDMEERGTVRRIDDRWSAGRAPRIRRMVDTSKYATLDPAQRDHERADTQQHIRREELKARIMEDLRAVRSPHVRETLKLAYDYLSGR